MYTLGVESTTDKLWATRTMQIQHTITITQL